MPLINTLREQSYKNGDSLGASQSKKKGKDEDDENKEDQGNVLTSTVANPPSFYQDHVDKWHAKFAKSVKDRVPVHPENGRMMRKISKRYNILSKIIIDPHFFSPESRPLGVLKAYP